MHLADRLTRFVIAAVLAALLVRASVANDAPPKEGQPPTVDPKEAEFFESRIRPILVERCFECHGAEKQKAGLQVDSRAGLLAGGDSGVALVPGKPDESLLIEAVRYSGDIKMPPKSKLPEAEIALLVEWVRRGAVWPNSAPAAKRASSAGGPLFTEEEKKFWAFQPVKDVVAPKVQNDRWCRSAIDRFILAGLEAKGLSPGPASDKRTLIRRATFDLTGLPPTPAEVAAFLADDSPEAFAKVVDRLLDSPQYGERWGRHWLDVARYADSNGLDENLAYANAFRYRDYVIAAFNKDKPFDLFLQEQLAGDLLPDSDDVAVQIERLTATGFLSLGAKMLAEDDPVKMQMDIIDEQVDTLGRAFLGLTLGCARCHEHKFDPIPQEDYYSLAGIFKSTKTMENFSVVARWQERPLAAPDVAKARDAHQQQITDKQADIKRTVGAAIDDLLRDARRHTGAHLLAAAVQQQLDERVQQARPIGTEPDAKDRPGVIVVEAEDFVRGNVLKDRDNYGKGIGVLVNKGEAPNFTEYELTVDSPGLRQVELRYAAAAARPCKLFINGRMVKSDAAGKVTGSWHPDTQTWFVEGFFAFEAGKNTVRLEHPEAFPHIDKLLIAPVAENAGLSLDFATRPAADGYVPRPEIVKQWVKYLERTRSEKDSILAVWHERFPPLGKGGPGAVAPQSDDAASPNTPPSDDATAAAVRALLLADPKPATLADLAARYDRTFAAAESTWQELKATAGKSATALPDAALEAFRKVLYDEGGPFAVPKNVEEYFPESVVADLKARREEVKTFEESLPKLPEAMAVADAKPENLRVHLRGSHLTLGAAVPRQFPRILAGEDQSPLGDAQSGRLELARWLTSADHPLTGRVIVNRLWQWHFGEGLVRSPDNFGRLGERPTHPELLDYLAGEIVRRGWSLKSMHRLLMHSSTYQMSTAYREAAAVADPENRLWWRMPRRRLEVEAIRDSILAVAGTLELTMGGTLLPTPNRQYVTSTASVNPAVYESPRRSIYLPVVRSALYEVFQAFDFADPSVMTGRRDSTTVAPQALFMMNSSFVVAQTKALAQQLLDENALDDPARVGRLYERALARPPSESETARALRFLDRYAQAAADRAPQSPAEMRLRAWQALCRAILASNEFVYVE